MIGVSHESKSIERMRWYFEDKLSGDVMIMVWFHHLAWCWMFWSVYFLQQYREDTYHSLQAVLVKSLPWWLALIEQFKFYLLRNQLKAVAVLFLRWEIKWMMLFTGTPETKSWDTLWFHIHRSYMTGFPFYDVGGSAVGMRTTELTKYV